MATIGHDLWDVISRLVLEPDGFCTNAHAAGGHWLGLAGSHFGAHGNRYFDVAR